ncbi:shikimate kinase AroK [Endozoicomonas sp.]|nr:shikimate kinase AroK [Endozoicomonas sp.]
MLLKNIYLIGPMGAGKTTIGRMLASELNMPFMDSDHEVEARSGANIPWIFDVEGEEGFRQREKQVIADLCAERGIVMATGGGAVKKADNRKRLRASGFVVYLHTPVRVQLERTAKDKQRPLLQRPDREQILTTLLTDREPLYRDIADLTLDTEELSTKAVIDKITQAIGTDGVCYV